MRPGLVCLAAAIALVISQAAYAGDDAATVETCFTPRQRCTGLIVSAIDHARREVRVEAYGFTSLPILRALAAAKGRGLDVAAILDKTNARPSRSRSGARFVSQAGVPVWIDTRSGIAHNKVIVIDGHVVVTGSFNFTVSADRRNAENVLVLESRAIAARYLANWLSLQAAARPYEDAGDDGPAFPPDRIAVHHRRHRRRSAERCAAAWQRCPSSAEWLRER